jgi:hypothetical protein
MCGARSTYGGQERCIQCFWWEDLSERDHLKDQCIYGRIILQRISLPNLLLLFQFCYLCCFVCYSCCYVVNCDVLCIVYV